MFSPFALLVDVVWLGALAGALATLSYNDWYRHLHGWSWSRIWRMPRLQLPLNGSLALLCVGLALNGVSGEGSFVWWQMLLWLVLALLFAIQAFAAWRNPAGDDPRRARQNEGPRTEMIPPIGDER